jgi:hypothetical protein
MTEMISLFIDLLVSTLRDNSTTPESAFLIVYTTPFYADSLREER